MPEGWEPVGWATVGCLVGVLGCVAAFVWFTIKNNPFR